jgi:hypothetical protein
VRGSSPAGGRLGNRPAMPNKTLRVRRLTLAPPPKLESADESPVVDEGRMMLDQERWARSIELTTVTATARLRRDTRHGVEPDYGSKFWATGNDDESGSESEEEDISTPMLVKEALDAGFSVEQVRQAEAEIPTPTSTSPKVKSLPKASISSKIVDVWVQNRKLKGKPRTGALAASTSIAAGHIR